MQSKQVSVFFVIFLYMMSTGLLNHVTILPALLETAGRDAWLAAIMSFAVYAAWVVIVVYIARATRQQNLHAWLKQRFGTATAYVFSALIVIYLFITASYSLKDMILWTNITYMPFTPQLVIALCFSAACLFLAATSLRSIVSVNVILLPVVIIFGFFVMSANFPKKDYSQMFPLFEHGFTPLSHGMVYAGSGLVEVLTILFLQHRLKTKISYTSLFIIGLLLLWLTLGPTIGALATFGADKSGQLRFPAYEQWALVSIGRFIEHLDSLSIYQWLSGAYIRVSLCLFMIIDLLHLSKKGRKWIIWALLVLLLVAVQIVPVDDPLFVKLLVHYILPGSLFFLLGLSFALALLAFIDNRIARGTRRKRKTKTA